jgi:DNA-directed RNA polymerase specialized sigma24 family protein
MLSVVPQNPAEEPDYGAELMLRVKAGDGTSFGRLLEMYHPAIVRFLYRKVQNRALAEELSQ